MSEIKEFLTERGWHTWYNESYWVNPKTVVNPMVQDYTNYGMSLDDAYEFEVMDKDPYPSVGHIQRAIGAK